MKTEVQSIWSKITNGATFKALVIGVLILIMLIPVNMIRSLIWDREQTSQAVTDEVSSKWGRQQTLTGPVIGIPYKYSVVENNVLSEIRDVAYFLPEELNVETDIQPEIRYRSIYKVVVYQSKIKAVGHFKHPDFAKLGQKATSVEWENAFVTLGITDLRGIRSNIAFNWDRLPVETMSGVGESKLIKVGVTARIPLVEKPLPTVAIKEETDANDRIYEFDITLTLNGSRGLYFTPVGKMTHVKASSTWNTPSFDGAFLPDSSNIGNGFSATWSVFNYNRNYPQMWTDNRYDLQSSEFGVNLLLPVGQYQKAMRSVKYAIMFITLTFLVFFLVELISRRRIHPLQYLLVSVGLVLFYCLLLALSEQIRFNCAYLLSALAIVGLITAYSYSIFGKAKQTLLMGIFLTTLYLFLYTILQLEDLALLIGSTGLFVALAAVMYISRKVDWYHTQSDSDSVPSNDVASAED